MTKRPVVIYHHNGELKCQAFSDIETALEWGCEEEGQGRIAVTRVFDQRGELFFERGPGDLLSRWVEGEGLELTGQAINQPE